MANCAAQPITSIPLLHNDATLGTVHCFAWLHKSLFVRQKIGVNRRTKLQEGRRKDVRWEDVVGISFYLIYQHGELNTLAIFLKSSANIVHLKAVQKHQGHSLSCTHKYLLQLTLSSCVVLLAAESFIARAARSSWYCLQFIPSWIDWGEMKKDTETEKTKNNFNVCIQP